MNQIGVCVCNVERLLTYGSDKIMGYKSKSNKSKAWPFSRTECWVGRPDLEC